MRLTFDEGATVPHGTMSIAQSIHGDAGGNVDNIVVGSFTPTRLLDIRWNDGVLSFGINDGPNVTSGSAVTISGKETGALALPDKSTAVARRLRTAPRNCGRGRRSSVKIILGRML